jgi:hypothetical protein
MLVGIPLLIVGVISWVVVASLAAVKASKGQSYRYPLTMRLVRFSRILADAIRFDPLVPSCAPTCLVATWSVGRSR